jgi:hypothetical protein
MVLSMVAFAKILFAGLLSALIMRLPWIGVPLALSAFLLSMRFMGRESPFADMMIFLGSSLFLTVIWQS